MSNSTRTPTRLCTCQECGAEFYDRGHGHQQKKCPECKIPRCRTCNEPVPLVLRGGPRGGLVRSGNYCSDDCKPRCPIEGCERPVRKRGWCANHYATWRDHGSPEAPTAYAWAEREACLACGNSDLTLWEKQSRKFCTDRCQATWSKYKGDIPTSFDCAVCGVEVRYFDPKTRKRLRSDAAYCPDHRTRRSRLFVTIQEIAATDGADCRICGDPIDLSIPQERRMGPSIDHIVPRAMGGSDDRENLQLAHYGCNASKRHSYIG